MPANYPKLPGWCPFWCPASARPAARRLPACSHWPSGAATGSTWETRAREAPDPNSPPSSPFWKPVDAWTSTRMYYHRPDEMQFQRRTW